MTQAAKVEPEDRATEARRTPGAARPSRAVAPAAAERRRFTVNLWATSINDVEIGIMRRTQHRAKSDQFTADMDVIGEVREGGERTGILAYREALWRERDDAKRRLVIKLFSASMNWRATMELLVGRSLQLTLGAEGLPVVAYALNLSRYDPMVQLERSADQWAFFPEKFTFSLLDGGEMRFFTLKQNVISIGADYTLLDQTGRKIGLVDGKVIDLGGVWRVSLDRDDDDPRLADALQLFCAMLRYNKAARAHIRRLGRDVAAAQTTADLDHHERDLYFNPRRRR